MADYLVRINIEKDEWARVLALDMDYGNFKVAADRAGESGYMGPFKPIWADLSGSSGRRRGAYVMPLSEQADGLGGEIGGRAARRDGVTLRHAILSRSDDLVAAHCTRHSSSTYLTELAYPAEPCVGAQASERSWSLRGHVAWNGADKGAQALCLRAAADRFRLL